MDNMLYIIVGLVVVLLVAVLVMRKNKAQRPVATNNKSANAQARISPTLDRATLDRTPIDSATTHATKFDSITIAQRFIDQKRYDKAIETLERGLTKKPYDSALLLKLLDIYVTTQQNDDFYRTYNTIQTHSDPRTIEQAVQLKNSMSGSPSEVASSAAFMDLDTLETNATVTIEPLTSAKNSTASTPAQDEFSLDFDTSYATDKNPNPAISTDTANDEQDNNNFDLTLDDLEALDLETIDNNFVKNKDADNSNQLIDNVANIDDDFNFAFEDCVENEGESLIAQPNDSPVIAEPLVETSSNARTDELITDELSFDDFVLDLVDDLQTDNSQISSSEALPTAQSDMQDFVFNLDDDTADSFIATDDGFDIEDTRQNNTSDHTTTLNEDIGFELADCANNEVSNDILNINTSRLKAENTFDNNTFNNISAPTIAQSHSIALESSHSSSNNPTIDADLGALSSDSPSDEWLIDDNFIANFDDPIDSDARVAAPVVELSFGHANEQSLVDFDSQFSADFDFVKSLDSQQVTLDLADQYLQLGEYDSARRLLAEVIEQGSHEQKQKAQALLARTT